MTDDVQLLREYVERGAEDAFRELVERHARMVHGVAWRVLGDHAAAEEAAQATFILLARKAPGLRQGVVLAGWLYRTAHFVAREARRANQRRVQHHETLRAMNESSETDWKTISPRIDDAMNELTSSDRDAVVLRFLEEKSYSEVAKAIGVSEAAAKMRVGRALEKLRGTLAREGMVLSVTALGTALAAHGAPEIPAGFVASISPVALAAGASTNTSLTALVNETLKIMAWHKLRNMAAVAIILLLLGGAAWMGRQYHWFNRAPVPLTVKTFEPMAGEWEGTFEMRGDGFPEPLRQKTALTIKTVADGRSCQIEMRVLAPNGRDAARTFYFTHTLSAAGDRIVTVDDPEIARPLGEGVVTAAANGLPRGEWRAGFHATLPEGGSTDCEWVRRADELLIVRHDRTATAQGESDVVSELRLRRVGNARL
jgi:RNA polymerase sigma factor (sigma-70 family)